MNTFSLKLDFHRKRAKLPFEEKFKIIMALQKIDIEMRKHRNNKFSSKKLGDDNLIHLASKFSSTRGKQKFKTIIRNKW